MGNYNIDVTTNDKSLKIKLEGNFTETDAINFIRDFDGEAKKIQTKEYNLSFDASSLKVSPQQMLPVLKGCFETYKRLGFKKVHINIGSSAVLKMQVNRVIKEVGLTNCELAN